MVDRKKYKGSNFDPIIGICPYCKRLMMLSDSIFDWVSRANYYIKCYKEVELKPAKI